MASYNGVQLEEEGIEFVAVPKSGTRHRRWVGLVAAVIAAVAATATYWPRHVTALHRLNVVKHGLVQAFSSRALLDDAAMQATLGLVINEVDKPDPEETGVTAVLQKSETGHKQISVKVTFNAKEGKKEDLAKQLQAIVDGQLKMTADMDGQEHADELKKLIEVSAGSDEEEASVRMYMPKEEEDMEKDMEDAMVEVSPKLTASLYIGSSVQDWVDNKAENAFTALSGIKADIHTAFANALVKAGTSTMPEHDMPPPEAMEVLKGISKLSSRQEIRYKSGHIWPSLPSTSKIVAHLSMMVLMLPASATEPARGFEENSDGVKTVELRGLPNNLEVLATFHNFHWAPLIKAALDGADKAKEQHQST